jgi:hypothetical protein
VEVDAGLQPAGGLQRWRQQLVGGARVGRRLEDDGAPWPHEWAEDRDGAPDRREVGHAVGERGGHGDDRDIVRAQLGRVGERAVAVGGQRPFDLAVGDVADVRPAGA